MTTDSPLPPEAESSFEDGSHARPNGTLSDPERRALNRSAFWSTARTLYRWRWFVVAVTVLAAVASVAIALQMPVWFASTARLLPPESDGASSMLSNVSPLAASFLGGGGTDFERYLAILNARTTRLQVVEELDLVEVYGFQDEPYPEEAALEALDDNLSMEVDIQYDFLSIQAFDQNPARAAQMANLMVRILNERNEALALEGASAYRRYVESRYQEVEERLEDARNQMQAFQQRSGVIELPTMAQALIESMAEARAQATRAEIEYQALLSELGPENPQVQAARQALATAEAAESRLTSGGEAQMPISLKNLPAAGAEYTRILQEITLQTALIENARPLLEQARFDEERERTAVQVLDPAVPATRKARPSRGQIVFLSTASAFLVACLFALAWSWTRRRWAYLASRLTSR